MFLGWLIVCHIRTSSHNHKIHFHIQNLPKRNWILIHSSNYASQLLGCIAPGKTYMVIGGKKVGVSSSKVAMGLLVDALPNKFKMEIKQV